MMHLFSRAHRNDSIVFPAVAHSSSRAQKPSSSQQQQRPAKDVFQSVPLFGGITAVGEYYALIHLGGQPLRVQVDTGSSFLAVPSKSCKTCRPAALRYDLQHRLHNASSNIVPASALSCGAASCRSRVCGYTEACDTCSPAGACCAPTEPEHCGFFLAYGDGSNAAGALVADELEIHGGLGNPANPERAKLPAEGITSRGQQQQKPKEENKGGHEKALVKSQPVCVTFGAVTRDSKDFEREQVDGIMGMGFAALACVPTCVEPPLDALVRKGVVEDDMFSLCMTHEGGVLTLGEFDPTTARNAVSYVPMRLSYPPTFYSVDLRPTMQVGGHYVDMPFRNAIVDSGTTLITMAPEAFDVFFKFLTKHFCDVPGLCGDDSWFKPAACALLTAKELLMMPNISFVVGRDLHLTLNASDYMIPYKVGDKTYRCVGFMTLDIGGGIDVILGNTLQVKYITVYDRVHSRIGFAERGEDCSGFGGCPSFSDCASCASAGAGCRYDYWSKSCRATTEWNLFHWLVIYPSCQGDSCFCSAENWIGWIPRILGVISFVLFMVIAYITWKKWTPRSGYRPIG